MYSVVTSAERARGRQRERRGRRVRRMVVLVVSGERGGVIGVVAKFIYWKGVMRDRSNKRRSYK